MSDLTPELAAKVLGADLRNLVKKIGSGGNLTSDERELMEKARLEGNLSEELLRARRAALLRKFASGHRLNADEQAEIASVIPATQNVVKRVTSEAYKKTLRDYVADFIGLGMKPSKDDARKLKNWIKHGRYDKEEKLRDEPDFPPFDSPELLAEWWRRKMVYSPPDWMVQAEKSSLDKPKAPDQASAAPSSAAPPAEGKAAPQADLSISYGDLVVEGELGNDFTVKILAGAALDNYRRYEDARKREDWRSARIIRAELIEDVKGLQRAKLEAQKLLAAAGDYLHAKKTMQALNELLAMQDTSFYNALDEVIRQVAPQIEPEERREIALKYRDRIFEHFHRTDFAEAYTPQEHNDA